MIRRLIRQLIVESIVDDLKKKHTEPRMRASIDFFAKNDPSGKNKYVRWMTKQLDNIIDAGGWEPDYDIVNVVRSFHDNPGAFSSNDINDFTYDTLRQEMLKIVPSRRSIKKLAKQGAIKVLETGQFSLYRIDARNACVQYGMGTKWCVSMANSDDSWNEYVDHSVLYLLIDRKTNAKYMFDFWWKKMTARGHVQAFTNIFDDADMELSRYDGDIATLIDGMTKRQEDQIWKTIRDDAKNSPWVKLNLGKLTDDEFRTLAQREPFVISFVRDNSVRIKAMQRYVPMAQELER